MTLQGLLIVGAILFCLGLFCVLTRKNAVSMLMGVELILNAANINFVAFSNYLPKGQGPTVSGHVFVLFSMVVAAAEAAVVLAIILAIFRKIKTIEADQMDSMRE